MSKLDQSLANMERVMRQRVSENPNVPEELFVQPVIALLDGRDATIERLKKMLKPFAELAPVVEIFHHRSTGALHTWRGSGGEYALNAEDILAAAKLLKELEG